MQWTAGTRVRTRTSPCQARGGTKSAAHGNPILPQRKGPFPGGLPAAPAEVPKPAGRFARRPQTCVFPGRLRPARSHTGTSHSLFLPLPHPRGPASCKPNAHGAHPTEGALKLGFPFHPTPSTHAAELTRGGLFCNFTKSVHERERRKTEGSRLASTSHSDPKPFSSEPAEIFALRGDPRTQRENAACPRRPDAKQPQL